MTAEILADSEYEVQSEVPQSNENQNPYDWLHSEKISDESASLWHVLPLFLAIVHYWFQLHGYCVDRWTRISTHKGRTVCRNIPLPKVLFPFKKCYWSTFLRIGSRTKDLFLDVVVSSIKVLQIDREEWSPQISSCRNFLQSTLLLVHSFRIEQKRIKKVVFPNGSRTKVLEIIGRWFLKGPVIKLLLVVLHATSGIVRFLFCLPIQKSNFGTIFNEHASSLIDIPKTPKNLASSPNSFNPFFSKIVRCRWWMRQENVNGFVFD